MNQELKNRIQTFVSWVHENAPRLIELEAIAIADQISELLLVVDDRLGIEVAEEIEDAREVIITAYSNPSLFPVVYSIVEQLSDLPGWKFIALKQPRGFSFKITLGSYQLKATSLRFAFLPNMKKGIQLILSPELFQLVPRKNEEAEELAWLIVETGIGEELAGKFEHIEFSKNILSNKHTFKINELMTHVSRKTK